MRKFKFNALRGVRYYALNTMWYFSEMCGGIIICEQSWWVSWELVPTNYTPSHQLGSNRLPNSCQMDSQLGRGLMPIRNFGILPSPWGLNGGVDHQKWSEKCELWTWPPWNFQKWSQKWAKMEQHIFWHLELCILLQTLLYIITSQILSVSLKSSLSLD